MISIFSIPLKIFISSRQLLYFSTSRKFCQVLFLKFFNFFKFSFSLFFPSSQECLSIISQARRFVNTFFEKISLFSRFFLTFRLSRRVLDYYITFFFFCQPFFTFFLLFGSFVGFFHFSFELLFILYSKSSIIHDFST